MNYILTILHIITAILIPIGTVALVILTSIKIWRTEEGMVSEDGTACLRCQQALPGGKGQFQYSKSQKTFSKRGKRNPWIESDPPILGTESHFVCDRCARRFLYNEMLQQALMALAYPAYLYVLLPLFAQDGIFGNFLIETLLLVLAVAGGLAAFDLYRAVQGGKTPLTEARDRVVINLRRPVLGKKFSYMTQFASSQQSDKGQR